MSKKPKEHEPLRKSEADAVVAEEDAAAKPVASPEARLLSSIRDNPAFSLRIFPFGERAAPATPAGMRTFAADAVAGAGRVPAGFRRGRIWA